MIDWVRAVELQVCAAILQVSSVAGQVRATIAGVWPSLPGFLQRLRGIVPSLNHLLQRLPGLVSRRESCRNG